MIHHGDLFTVLPSLDAESIDACVTDPPYGLEFMGKKWDSFGRTRDYMPRDDGYGDKGVLPGYGRGGTSEDRDKFKRKANSAMEDWAELWATDVFRVLKPGAHLVAFGGTRTFHRLTAGIEDAGFEIRDCLSWLYGSGFPKSLNVGNGRGTALKPAWEPIILARKPTQGTVAANVLAHSTGALNVDACRLSNDHYTTGGQNKGIAFGANLEKQPRCDGSLGRWPANVLLDEDAAAMLDEQTGDLVSNGGRPQIAARNASIGYGGSEAGPDARLYGDVGGASRFYYVAKPCREERDFGCEDLLARTGGEATDRTDGSAGLNNPRAGAGRTGGSRNVHPTVKPVELMRWLVKLVTPIDGVVLDPFMGSGTTGMACRYEHRQFIGIERETDYIRIAEARIAAVAPLFGEATA